MIMSSQCSGIACTPGLCCMLVFCCMYVDFQVSTKVRNFCTELLHMCSRATQRVVSAFRCLLSNTLHISCCLLSMITDGLHRHYPVSRLLYCVGMHGTLQLQLPKSSPGQVLARPQFGIHVSQPPRLYKRSVSPRLTATIEIFNRPSKPSDRTSTGHCLTSACIIHIMGQDRLSKCINPWKAEAWCTKSRRPTLWMMSCCRISRRILLLTLPCDAILLPLKGTAQANFTLCSSIATRKPFRVQRLYWETC